MVPVEQLVSELIRMDTSNYGDDRGPGEIEAAEYVAQRLRRWGYDPELVTTTSSRRAGVFLRVEGQDPQRAAFMVHGHLDVVPALESTWTHAPFGGVIDDGVVWGRGAVDMKDMLGMTMSVLQRWSIECARPGRDIVFAFLPDEEAGMKHGSHWLVDNRPELFAGVTEAIGEIGGFSITFADDLRIYPIQTAEKGLAWLRLTASGEPGHGSLIHTDTAVDRLCAAAARIGAHEFDVHLTDTMRDFLDRVSAITGLDLSTSAPGVIDPQVMSQLGSLGRLIGGLLRDTANVTMLDAGAKVNQVPGFAEAAVDGRFLPGRQEQFLSELDSLLGPGIEREFIHFDESVETSFDGPSVDLMIEAIGAHDEHGHVVPLMIPAGTDAKALARLGIRCYGFSPLKLPAGTDYWSLFHGVDERVSVDALHFGVDVLDYFLKRV